MTVNSTKTKMPPPQTGMTERILSYEEYSETSQSFKIECQSDHAAMSDKWCILAVTFMWHLKKLTSSYLV